MTCRRGLLPAFVVAAAGVSASAVQAQPLGTFRWQLQPFCNIVTVAVTQNGAVYLVCLPRFSSASRALWWLADRKASGAPPPAGPARA